MTADPYIAQRVIWNDDGKVATVTGRMSGGDGRDPLYELVDDDDPDTPYYGWSDQFRLVDP